MKIWKFEDVGGQEFEVSDNYPVMFPFTDVPPREDYPIEQQSYVPSEGKWLFIGDLALKDEFDNLKARYEGLKNELEQANKDLAESQKQLDAAGSGASKAMLATIKLERKVQLLLDNLTTTTTTTEAEPITTTTTLKGDE